VYSLPIEQNMAMYSAALYIRLSKEDDNTVESESITNQRSLLQDFCTRNRIYVYDEYIDDGFSGGNFERPSFKRMVEDIERKQVNMVITKDMSRFGRDYIQTGYYMERYFPEKSVRYISLLDGIDTGMELSANEITPFRAIINDLYAKDISKKIKSVKRDKQRKGLFIGGKPPYGYKSMSDSTNFIMIDENAAVVVREIFAMALSGVSGRQIAVKLNENCVQTPAQYAGLTITRKGPYSGKWSAERVTEMLKNRVYVGDMVQHRVEKVSYKSPKTKKLPREDWIIVENTHEPIVKREDFDNVQMLIQSRQRTRVRKYEHLLKGVVFCKECQVPLGVLNRPNALGETRLYYVCRTYQRFTKDSACTCHCVRVSRVEGAVVARIRAICVEYLDKKTRSIAAGKAIDGADNKWIKQEVQRLTLEVESLTTKMDKLYDDRLNGILDDLDFSRVYGNIKTARNAAQERLDKVFGLENEQPMAAYNVDELVERFIQEAGTNKALLCALVEKIEMSQEKEVLIRYRFAPEEVLDLQ